MPGRTRPTFTGWLYQDAHLNVALPPRSPDSELDARVFARIQYGGMRPVDIQQIGEELAIKWDDGSESFVSLEKLRRHCPCAGCKGEMDIMGNLYKNPARPFAPHSFQLRKIASIGTYAIQPIWADGHESGIFSFDYLRQVAQASE